MGFINLLTRNKKALFGLCIVGFFILTSIFAPFITEYNAAKRVTGSHVAPSQEHVLGSTRMGRDVFAQTLYGGRVSLAVGFGAGIIVVAMAVAIGITAGYFGGIIDEVLSSLMNIMLVIPQLPLLMVLAAFIGEVSPMVIAMIIGLTSWAWGARVVRSQTLAVREKEFVVAAQVLGEPSWRIILIEILPNLVSIIGASFIGSVIYAIMTQATLEFLGLGDPTSVTWGTQLFNMQKTSAIHIGAYWEVFSPIVVIACVGAGLALLNFAVDEIANPQLRSHVGLKRWKQITAQKEAEAAQEATAQQGAAS
ncbi:ABC transporter permease [Motilimonas cestriensis]|uniref:ABC transporter permease n=1 Tax=Motilimonas cestriensis TaxID=2742685 RepID=A0ABS8WAC1_9GAMM|nr:ABC transporter permease [Motilimonas cestriensis]MCE2595435.1 ABC transporter permease [Motilimonas cestriensis]